jgi:hypothetical protein
MRVFQEKRTVLIIGRCMLVFLALFGISGSLAMALQCNPVKAGYDKSILITNPDAKCYSGETMFGLMMYQGVVMFVADVIIIVLPMPSVWALNINRKKKFLLIGMFSVGFVACVAALVRFSTLAFAKDSTDYTYTAATSLIWMNLEYSLGLASGSLSSLRQLFRITSFSHNSAYAPGTSNASQGYSRPVPDLATTKGYELDDRSEEHRWEKKKSGIVKTSEVKTETEDGRSESRERIVPNWGEMNIRA